MMLSLDTAYRSFGGEVEASSTPTICRLSDSRRHQLSAITLGDPTSLTESARLLEIAAGKGNAVGHFTLGLHLLEGIGIEKDAHRGVAELLMASFAGSTDAAE